MVIKNTSWRQNAMLPKGFLTTQDAERKGLEGCRSPLLISSLSQQHQHHHLPCTSFFNNNVRMSEFLHLFRHNDAPRQIETTPNIALGIDTVKLFIPISDAYVSSQNELRVVTNEKRFKKRRLWVDEWDQPTMGVLAYCRRNGVNLLIRPYFGESGLNTVGCFVFFSISGICGNGDNLWPASHIDIQRAFTRVEQVLSSMGVMVDIRKATLSRLDMFINVVTPNPCAEYIDLFHLLHPSRMVKIPYRTGFRHGNKQHQLVGYDKKVEREFRGRDVSYLIDNVFRLEYRLLRAEKCKTTLQAKTVEELLRRSSSLPEIYAEAIRQYWLRFNCEELATMSAVGKKKPSTQSQIQLVVRHIQRQNRSSPSAGRVQKQLEQAIRQQGIAGYEKSLKELPGVSRQYASQASTNMKKAMLLEVMSKQGKLRRTYEEALQVLSCVKNPTIPMSCSTVKPVYAWQHHHHIELSLCAKLSSRIGASTSPVLHFSLPMPN